MEISTPSKRTRLLDGICKRLGDMAIEKAGHEVLGSSLSSNGDGGAVFELQGTTFGGKSAAIRIHLLLRMLDPINAYL